MQTKDMNDMCASRAAAPEDVQLLGQRAAGEAQHRRAAQHRGERQADANRAAAHAALVDLQKYHVVFLQLGAAGTSAAARRAVAAQVDIRLTG